ncbi:MAG: sugar nucleotide-binding protein [Planctomycetaceae bacterium]
MKKILITGAGGVTGGNLAAVLAGQFDVTATNFERTTIAGCRNLTCQLDESLAVQVLFSTVEPDVAIHCGAFADSSWNRTEVDATETQVVRNLCKTAEAMNCRFVMVSSDAVYRGPWMFHTEDSECRATTRAAKLARQCEELVLALTSSLILRTNVVGWSPSRDQLVESFLGDLMDGNEFEFGHFTTPIGATQFAGVVADAVAAELSGIYNVGGAERCSPYGFASVLSKEFELPLPISSEAAAPLETSLRSAAIRERLFVGLPTLKGTVRQLFEEHDDRVAAFAGVSKQAAAA